MKVVAQSVKAPKMFYLHLAYLAAKTLKPNSLSIGVGSTFMVTGLTLLLIVKPLKKRQIHGYLLLFTGIALFLSSYLVFGKKEYAHPKGVTNGKIKLMEFHYNHECKTEASWEKYLAENKDKFIDAWNNKMKVDKEIVDGKTQYKVTSPGSDGKFGTKDDISRVLKKYNFPSND